MSECAACTFDYVFESNRSDLWDDYKLTNDHPVDFDLIVDLAVVNGLVVDQNVLHGWTAHVQHGLAAAPHVLFE